MPLLNEASLRRYEDLRKAVNGELLDEAMEKSASAPPDKPFDVFLSHASGDRERGCLAPLLRRLKDLSLEVYVDAEADSDLNRAETDADAARRIRRRIRYSKALLYATSPTARVSGWMKWELGLADGMRKNVAVVPILPGSTVKHTFKSQEFIGIYPHVFEEEDERGRGILSRALFPPALHVQTSLGPMALANWVNLRGRLVLPVSRRLLREISEK